MSTGPSKTIGSPTKFMYVRMEGHFVETGLFYCFAVLDILSKSNQISIKTSDPFKHPFHTC